MVFRPLLLNAIFPMLVTLASLSILCVAIIVAHTTVFGGLINFLKLKADGDSFPALAVLACLAECVVFLIFPEALDKSGLLRTGEEAFRKSGYVVYRYEKNKDFLEAAQEVFS